MENSSKFLIDYYYKELQAVEKSLQSNSKTNLRVEKPKTFLKNKNELSIRKVKQQDKKIKKHQFKQNRLSLDTLKGPSFQIETKIRTNQIPLKYLQNIDESIIDKNILENSILTKSENNKIVLEIHGLELRDEDQQTIKYYRSPKKNTIEQKKQFQNINLIEQSNNRNQESFIFNSETAAQRLIQVLKQRDRIYKIVNTKCTKNANIEKQFEQLWLKNELYEKLIQKLSKIWSRN